MNERDVGAGSWSVMMHPVCISMSKKNCAGYIRTGFSYAVTVGSLQFSMRFSPGFFLRIADMS
jgi:hypothetical protein